MIWASKESNVLYRVTAIELKAEDKAAKSIITSINTYYILCIFQLVILVIVTFLTIFNYQEYFKRKSII